MTNKDLYHIRLMYIDEVHFRVVGRSDVIAEMSESFTFYVPGYKFMPLYKAGAWDGKIRMVSMGKPVMYKGLVEDVKKFCNDRGYSLYVDPKIEEPFFTEEQVEAFISEMELPFDPYEHQKQIVKEILVTRHRTLLAATSAGKSYSLFLTAAIIRKHQGRTLIIVPSTLLADQLAEDFAEYGAEDSTWDDNDVHRIYSGKEKITNHSIVISTWQSAVKQSKGWTNEFDCILVDEAHGAKSKELIKLMERTTEVRIKAGLTGTLDDTDAHEFTIKGLLGPVSNVIEGAELIEKGMATACRVEAVVLKHSKPPRKPKGKKITYQDEVDFLIDNEERNNFIMKLAAKLKGNTLVLYRYVDRHGLVLYDEMLKRYPDRKIYHLSGKSKQQIRLEVKKILETEENAILIASIGILAVGVSIKKLHNLVFAHPNKSKIKVLQSIGRLMRLHEDKNEAVIWDIVDDLRGRGKKSNVILGHFIERLKYYAKAKIPYKIHKIKL